MRADGLIRQRLSEAMTNKYPGPCSHCGVRLKEHEGRLSRYEGGSWALHCPRCSSDRDLLMHLARGSTRAGRQYGSRDQTQLERHHQEFASRKDSRKGEHYSEQPGTDRR